MDWIPHGLGFEADGFAFRIHGDSHRAQGLEVCVSWLRVRLGGL